MSNSNSAIIDASEAIMPIEVRHIRAFHAVARDSSFRQASEHLRITQPALSRTIKELEELIRVRLFERTTRVVGLTESGRIFRKHTAHLIDEIDFAVDLAQRSARGMVGELRVGFNDHAISGLVPEVVRRFRAAYPDVDVTLISGSTPTMQEMVLDGQVDVGFCTGQYSHVDLDHTLVRKEHVICVLPASHSLANSQRISITDLSNEPFIMGRWASWRSFNRLIQDYCRGHGVVQRVVQEAEDSNGIIGFVAAGMGVTLFVDSTWIRALSDVAIRPLRERPPQFHTIATWRRDRRVTSATIDHFVETVADVVRRRGLVLK
jgi:DNA-binding transcriptional LysR family regulator